MLDGARKPPVGDVHRFGVAIDELDIFFVLVVGCRIELNGAKVDCGTRICRLIVRYTCIFSCVMLVPRLRPGGDTHRIAYQMVQVQVRMPKGMVEDIDQWIREGRFSSRSEAIKMVMALFQEKEKTRAFYNMLTERSKEAKEQSEIMKRII